MKTSFLAKNLTITDAIRDHVIFKIQKLHWTMAEDAEVQTTLTFGRGLYRCEFTIHNDGSMLRAEVSTGDLMASIDQAVEKLERQIQRHRRRVTKGVAPRVVESFEPLEADEPEDEGLLVRTKRFYLKPMNVEEAIQQMELLGHAFFVFLDDHQNTCVVYRRNDGHYGMLEPEIG